MCYVLQAFGRALLQVLERGRYINEGFIACYQLRSSTAYIIITRVHLLAVSVPYIATSSWAPSLLWAAALGDIELCKVQDGAHAELNVLVMQPVLSLAERQFELVQKTMGLRVLHKSPWQHYAAAFEVSKTHTGTMARTHCFQHLAKNISRAPHYNKLMGSQSSLEAKVVWREFLLWPHMPLI